MRVELSSHGGCKSFWQSKLCSQKNSITIFASSGTTFHVAGCAKKLRQITSLGVTMLYYHSIGERFGAVSTLAIYLGNRWFRFGEVIVDTLVLNTQMALKFGCISQ